MKQIGSYPTNKLHENIANQLIKKLEQGTAPWQLPWESASANLALPYNAVTGNRYKGINILSLLLSDHGDPRWVTYKQAESKGWQVRKGEKAVAIQFRKTSEFVPVLDEAGNKVLNEQGKPEGYTVRLEHPIIKTAWVFNAQQVNGMPPLENERQAEHAWTPIERAERLVRATGAKINHIQGNKAYYNPIADEITLPLTSQFSSPDRYYATALHEIGHWTGHAARLDRRIMNRIGTPEYAREELRAEIASLLIGHELKIGHDPGQHAAYVNAWIKTLRDTPTEILAATADAERIYDYVMDYERLYSRDIAASGPEAKIVTMNPRALLPADDLTMGQEVSVNGSTYKMTGVLKRGRIRLEELASGMEISVSRQDPFYQTLLEAGRNQTAQEQSPSSTTNIRPETHDSNFQPDISR